MGYYSDNILVFSNTQIGVRLGMFSTPDSAAPSHPTLPKTLHCVCTPALLTNHSRRKTFTHHANILQGLIQMATKRKLSTYSIDGTKILRRSGPTDTTQGFVAVRKAGSVTNCIFRSMTEAEKHINCDHLAEYSICETMHEAQLFAFGDGEETLSEEQPLVSIPDIPPEVLHNILSFLKFDEVPVTVQKLYLLSKRSKPQCLHYLRNIAEIKISSKALQRIGRE